MTTACASPRPLTMMQLLNNVLAKDFFYTADVYGHDDEASLDAELRLVKVKTLPASLIRLDTGRFTTAPTLGLWPMVLQ